jgi:XRE family aerobic/anaerobic benzoate catabolism transcriptional regulator
MTDSEYTDLATVRVDPAGETQLLSELGERVRRLRNARGLTRRQLAHAAQVSERYLAQLETGAGNASILVLHRVASALGHPLADLLTDAPPAARELELLQRFLQDFAPPVLRRIREHLQREYGAGHHGRAGRIALLGLRGAGKSTLGRALAQHYGQPFIELDREIERAAGAPLDELFLLYGQSAYRRYERRCLESVLATHPRCVIATGGSLVSDTDTFRLLSSACRTVWLRAAPEEHMARVIAQGDLRPMAGNLEAMADLRRILDERAPYYAEADLTLDTTGKPVADTLAALVAALEIHSPNCAQEIA